jgi:hypothetical protein
MIGIDFNIDIAEIERMTFDPDLLFPPPKPWTPVPKSEVSFSFMYDYIEDIRLKLLDSESSPLTKEESSMLMMFLQEHDDNNITSYKLKERLLNSNSKVIFAHKGTKPIGFNIFSIRLNPIMNLKRVDLHAVFVDPLYRRKGIAKASVNFMFSMPEDLVVK